MYLNHFIHKVVPVNSLSFQRSNPPHRPHVGSRESGESRPAVSPEKREWELVTVIKLKRRPLDGGGSNAMIYISELKSKPVHASRL